MRAIKEIGSFE